MKERIYSLDELKTVAAILVCFQHSALVKGLPHEYVLGLSKIAVPLFMMITGFMYRDTIYRNNGKKQIIKFLKIGIEMFAIWFTIDGLISIINGDFFIFLHSIVSLDNIIRFLLCNDPVIADHSWYIWAMLYVLIFYILIPKANDNFVLQLLLVVISIISQLLVGKYSFVLGSINSEYLWARSAWTVSFTYFTLGIWIRKYCKYEQLNLQNILLWMISSLIIYTIEFIYLQRVNVKGTGYMFSIILLSVSTFIYFLHLKRDKPTILSKIGTKYSLALYMLHPIFVRVETKFIDLHLEVAYVGFLLVTFFSLMLAIAYEKTKSKLRK